MIKSGVQTAQKQRFKQPNTASVQKVQVEDIQICNNEVEDIQICNDGSTTAINSYKGQKGQMVQVEDFLICNDGVKDIQMNTTAINSNEYNGYKQL